jgi:hypothetical protein
LDLSRKQSSDNRKNAKNLLRFHGDAAASAVDEAAASYQAPSIIAAGADAQTVSVLTTLVNLSLSLICIKAPTLIERIGKTKKGAVILAFLNLCAWVPLIIAFLLSPLGIQPIWYALLWVVNVMPGLLLTFQRDNWLFNLVPQEKLGRYLGQRLAIKSAFYLGAFCFLGFLLDSMGNSSLVNFGLVFAVAVAVALVDFVIFTFMHDPKEKENSPPKLENQPIKFGLFNFIGELKTKKLDTFISFTSLFYLTVGLSGPLYAVYMLQEKHFTYLSFTVIIAAEYLARVVSAPFWGRFADRSGNIRVLGIVTRIIPIIPICWLFCSNIGYLAIVQTLSGICWGAFDLCTQNYVFKVAPEEKKLRYIVYTRCIILFSTALGGLIGVFLIKGVFTIFGSPLLSIFLISGFFRAIVVMFFMPKLIDLAVSYATKSVSPKVNLDTSGRAKVTKHGLFYHREKPPLIVPEKKNISVLSPKFRNIMQRRSWMLDERPIMAKKGTIELSTDIQITPRRSWTMLEKATREPKESPQRLEITPSRRPWFRDPEIFSAYGARSRDTSIEMMDKNNRGTISRDGLFYNSDGWASYKRESLQAAIKESQRWKNADGNMRLAFVENESEWRPWRDSNPRPTS